MSPPGAHLRQTFFPPFWIKPILGFILTTMSKSHAGPFGPDRTRSQIKSYIARYKVSSWNVGHWAEADIALR